MRRILVDSGILLSYYQRNEPLHPAVVAFFDQTAAQLITSPICIAEVLWLLGDPGDARVLAAQNHLLGAVSRGGIEAVHLLPEDYARVADLNDRYADLPGDFADLTLVALSERLDVKEILSLDGDFDVYRRFRREPFQRVMLGRAEPSGSGQRGLCASRQGASAFPISLSSSRQAACNAICDVNGRTARALFYWAMLHQGYWLFEFISITSVINKARGQYEHSFLHSESDDNDLTYFLLAQVKVIQQAIASLHAYLERKASEVGALQQLLEGMEGLNHHQLALLRHALRHSGFRYSVLSHQNSHGVSHQTARSDLQKLAARGLLRARKDGRWEIFRVPEDLATRLPG